MPEGTLDYQLRPVTDGDAPFVRRLYVETMEPLLSAFAAWDTDKNIASFNQHYRVSEAKIIVVDSVDAGWLQIHEEKNDVSLHQLHIQPSYRNHGIGTRIINELIGKTEEQGNKLTLSVVKNNRAVALYRRLGFKIVGEDDTKFHLSR